MPVVTRKLCHRQYRRQAPGVSQTSLGRRCHEKGASFVRHSNLVNKWIDIYLNLPRAQLSEIQRFLAKHSSNIKIIWFLYSRREYTQGCLRQSATSIYILKKISADHLREAESTANRPGELNSTQLSRSIGDKDRGILQCRWHVERSHMPDGIAGSNGDLVAGTSQAYICLQIFLLRIVLSV